MKYQDFSFYWKIISSSCAVKILRFLDSVKILRFLDFYLSRVRILVSQWLLGEGKRRNEFASLRSKRFRASSSRKVGTRAKKREWLGRGRGKKETLARKPHDFEKLRSPTNAASDWCGAGSVDYLALETSIKPGMLCLRASQIWSYLICGRRCESCLCVFV